MIFKKKEYKEGYKDGYNQAVNDVLKILNKHDRNPEDFTKFSLKCFDDVRRLDKVED